jgi:hypothetical protein
MAYTIPRDAVVKYEPAAMNEFPVYCYEYIDNLHFTRPPSEFIPEGVLDSYLAVALKCFKDAGWDGDGEICLLWIPPFAFPGTDLDIGWDGLVVWVVKQTEDGLTWILSPIELPFDFWAKWA